MQEATKKKGPENQFQIPVKYSINTTLLKAVLVLYKLNLVFLYDKSSLIKKTPLIGAVLQTCW